MDDYNTYEIAKVWFPDESKGVVKLSSFSDGMGRVSLHFDDEYTLYVSKDTLLNLKSLINESIYALDAFEKFDTLKDKLVCDAHPNNVLEFKRKDDD